jgi:hypothetical protein
MPVALFIAGNFWLVAALTFGFASEEFQVQPDMYRFLSSTFDSQTYYTFLAMFVSAAVICFVLSYVAWRRQHNPPMQSTGAAGAFPVIPASDESGPRD